MFESEFSVQCSGFRVQSSGFKLSSEFKLSLAGHRKSNLKVEL
jgi:hypothetical protein